MAARGQYIQGNSIAHRLDPRVKLVSNIILIVLVFMTESFIVQGILVLPILFLFLQSGAGLAGIRRIFKSIIFLSAFLFIANMIIMQPVTSDPWYGKYEWGLFILTFASVMRTLLISSRIFAMILVTSLLTTTSKPMALTRAIEDVLFPLKLIKVPVHIIAMIMSIALRFIPTLMSETQRIMKAQASRGVDYKNGNLKAKIKSMVTLIIPLFVSAFSKAEDLGNAMETRGYDPYEKRTRYRHYPIKWVDVFATMVMVGLIVVIVLSENGTIPLPNWDTTLTH